MACAVPSLKTTGHDRDRSSEGRELVGWRRGRKGFAKMTFEAGETVVIGLRLSRQGHGNHRGWRRWVVPPNEAKACPSDSSRAAAKTWIALTKS